MRLQIFNDLQLWEAAMMALAVVGLDSDAIFVAGDTLACEGAGRVFTRLRSPARVVEVNA